MQSPLVPQASINVWLYKIINFAKPCFSHLKHGRVVNYSIYLRQCECTGKLIKLVYWHSCLGSEKDFSNIDTRFCVLCVAEEMPCFTCMDLEFRLESYGLGMKGT